MNPNESTVRSMAELLVLDKEAEDLADGPDVQAGNGVDDMYGAISNKDTINDSSPLNRSGSVRLKVRPFLNCQIHTRIANIDKSSQVVIL